MFLSKLGVHTAHMQLTGNTLKTKQSIFVILSTKVIPAYFKIKPLQTSNNMEMSGESECPVVPSPETATGNNWVVSELLKNSLFHHV